MANSKKIKEILEEKDNHIIFWKDKARRLQFRNDHLDSEIERLNGLLKKKKGGGGFRTTRLDLREDEDNE